MSNLGATAIALAILAAGFSIGSGLHHLAEAMYRSGGIFINTIRKQAQPEQEPEDNE